MTIWKWEFDVQQTFRDEVRIVMPGNATLLQVQRPLFAPTRPGAMPVWLWGRVNPSWPKVQRHIQVIGTGNPSPQACGIYLGTIQYPNGLVFHFFDDGESELPAS